MSALPYLVTYLGLSVSLIAVLARAVRWARLPLHVRWELYPVGHARSGEGSYLEDAEWWQKPRRASRLASLLAMAEEILLLSAVRQHNRPLWRWTFPFHVGLYLVSAAVASALLSGVVASLGGATHDGSVGGALRLCTVAAGASGLTLGVIGALGLLYRRLSVPEVRAYTVPADVFNLLFFILAFGSGLVTFVLIDPGAERALGFATRLVAFDLAPFPGEGLDVVLPIITVVLNSLLAAYVPLTHMSHFVAKYFAYHAVRWNDEPNLRGGRHEAAIEALLAKKVTWAAPHVGGRGARRWIDLVAELPEDPPR